MQKTIGKIGIIAVCAIGLAGCAASHSGPDKHEVATAYREYLNKRFGAIPKDTKNRAGVIRFIKKSIHVKGCRPSKKANVWDCNVYQEIRGHVMRDVNLPVWHINGHWRWFDPVSVENG
ncbi:hypothetical protein [Acidithiobacillus thiooxidans]|uniref:hypothetical protein n=1 Tax=Acidithiobacillus thiooxidans TaxID=930 RepID=UPI00356B5FFF|nr:hypothetical protein [Acidithiobacillus sp.]